MAELVRTAITSLDGSVADVGGRFDWAAPDDEVHAFVKASSAVPTAPLSVGGPGLAAAALAAGLVDELRWIAVPVLLGGGTRWLPDGIRAGLELVDDRRFGSGAAYRRYRIPG